MNREIKFRLWDKSLKRFCLSSNIFISADGFSIFGAESIDGAFRKYYKLDFNNFVIQQFTGLLDKNGLELYEGDIITYLAPNVDAPKEYIESPPSIIEGWYGEFLLSPIRFTNKDGKHVWSAINLYRHLIKTKIGNIFENPELIK